MEITKNAIENMMIAYVDHKKMIMEYENEQDEFELEEDPEYLFHKGCCETAEQWMRAIGVSPQCNFVMDRIYG